ncbi:hypothetical protein [Noviherbaspirillum soli]|uniref:hypothetical protein n=1 Tax=Noviherbaspirillum soli TaxID=1064518 RepID=UPI00188BB0AA|nr:hypothetical protein [Noviherbaspirillum soli]
MLLILHSLRSLSPRLRKRRRSELGNFRLSCADRSGSGGKLGRICHRVLRKLSFGRFLNPPP